MEAEQDFQDVAQSEEHDESQQSSKRSKSFGNKSFEEGDPLIQLCEKLDQMKAKVMNMDYGTAPLNDKSPLPTTIITENLIKLLQENEADQEFPATSFQKVMGILDKDIEDCTALIKSISETIENETNLQQKISEQRKVLSTLREQMNSESYEAPEDISIKVRSMFKKVKADLHELISLINPEKHEEMTTILAELTNAYLNEAGTQGQYVKVDIKWDNDCIVFLVSNRIAIWNPDHTHLKLHM